VRAALRRIGLRRISDAADIFKQLARKLHLQSIFLMQNALLHNNAHSSAAPASGSRTGHPSDRGWAALNFREVWQFRDLLLTLAARDVKLRYRQTALGPMWVLLGPLLSAGVFSFIFTRLAIYPPTAFRLSVCLYWIARLQRVFANNHENKRQSGRKSATRFQGVLSAHGAAAVGRVFVLIDFAVALSVTVGLMCTSGHPLQQPFFCCPCGCCCWFYSRLASAW
jgi:hypothetical protein